MQISIPIWMDGTQWLQEPAKCDRLNFLIMSFEEIRRRNEELTEKLLALTGREPAPAGEPVIAAAPVNADAIVAHIEINDHHGVGVLVRRLFGEYPNLISVRSRNYYGGVQAFGSLHACIAHANTHRDAVMWRVLEGLKQATVRRALAIPYFADDVRNAIAIRDIYSAPLCTFLMDDQNLCSDGIPDDLMAELLKKSDLCLAISPEMCAAYEEKFGTKIWFMPPVAPTSLIPRHVNQLSTGTALRDRQPVILGNIWGQQWLELLRSVVRGTGMTIRWYNNGEFRWLSCSKEELLKDGIVPQEGQADPDERLVEILRQAPFVVLPSGTLDDKDDRRFIAELSFPSRIPYILATSHAPILVLGNAETAAARIVTRFGVGLSVPYGRGEFLRAVEHITTPDVNQAMRRAAHRLSLRFADLGAAEWIWQSLDKGEPVDRRYEDLQPDTKPDVRAVLRRQIKQSG